MGPAKMDQLLVSLLRTIGLLDELLLVPELSLRPSLLRLISQPLIFQGAGCHLNLKLMPRLVLGNTTISQQIYQLTNWSQKS